MSVVDDSFKKPGSVPFKWEIRPGVPKLQPPALPPPPSPSHHLHCSSVQHQQQIQSPNNHHRSCHPPPKLSPPPAGLHFQSPQPQLEFRVCSFRSAPRTRSDHIRFDRRSILAGPQMVDPGCFPATPLLKRKNEKKRTTARPRPVNHPEPPEYVSDLETLSRWSESSRKSLSPFRDSPLSWSSSSSFSSYQSSPRPCPVDDAEWAGFGLF